MRPIDGSRSMAGRKLLRMRAAFIDTRRMSSASTRSLSACTFSAPKPLITRMPDTVSSTTVANWACSACTASTAGWMRRENRFANTLTSGRGARATTASSGCDVTSSTTTARIMATFDKVSGSITMNACSCCRSDDARLINCPVAVRSWYPACKVSRWAKIRSRSRVSDQRLSRKAIQRRNAVNSPAITPAAPTSPAHRASDPLPSIPRSIPNLVSCGTATLPAVQARPMATPAISPHFCSASV